MAEMLASSGPVLCAAVFFLGFVVVSVIESYRPRARLVAPLGRRWIANIGLYLLYFVLFAAAGDVPYTFVFWGESYGIAALGPGDLLRMLRLGDLRHVGSVLCHALLARVRARTRS